jgi:hypothetical protein
VSGNGLAGPGNGGRHGIFLAADNGNISASISTLTIGGNQSGAGLLFAGGFLGNTITSEIGNNEITGNGATVANPFGGGGPNSLEFGGAVFVTGGTPGFTGNRVHDNLRHAVSVFRDPGGGGTMSLSGGGGSCSSAASAPNQLSCYGAFGGTANVGVAAYDGVTVVADFDSWNVVTPVSGVDYAGFTAFGGGPGTVTVNAANVCAQAATHCP